MANCAGCGCGKSKCCECEPSVRTRKRRRGRNCCGFQPGDLTEAAELIYDATTDQMILRTSVNVADGSLRIGSPAPGVRSWIFTSTPVPNASFDPVCSGGLVVATVPKFGPPNPAAPRFQVEANLLSSEPVPGRPDCMTATVEITFYDPATGAFVDPAAVTAATGIPFAAVHFGVFMGGFGGPIQIG